jgi:uncharacterized protein (DUF433 family)
MGWPKASTGKASGKLVYFASRIPERTRTALKQYAVSRRLSESAAASQLLEEGLRMERFPGIDFRWTPSGRKAHVTGTGLSAWEVHLLWEAHGGKVAGVRRHYPHLSAAQVQAGAAYIGAHPEEIPAGERPAFAKIFKV